jgi:hypothetical protein
MIFHSRTIGALSQGLPSTYAVIWPTQIRDNHVTRDSYWQHPA